MTIRFIQQWNGYSPDQIVSGLGTTEETRLVSLGFATTDLDGPGSPEGELVRLSTDATGNTVLVGGDGIKYSIRGGLDEDGLLLIGDSTSEQNTANHGVKLNLGYAMQEQIQGYAIWMNALLKGRRFDRIYNYGKSGARAFQWVYPATDVNYDPEKDVNLVLAACPARDVLIKLGTNDAVDGGGRTSEQIIADITEIALRCKNAGRRVAIASVMPRRAADLTWTVSVQQKMLRVNAGIKKLCLNEGYGYIPVAEKFTDYTQLTTFVAPATTGRNLYDNVHENNYGAFKEGKLLATYYSALRADRPFPSPMHFIDNATSDGENTNLLTNPLFNTSSGYTLPTVSGIVSAISSSVVAAPDGVGNALQIDITTNARGLVNLFFAAWDNTPALVAGDTIIPAAKVRVTANGADSGAPTNVGSVGLRGLLANHNGDFYRAEMQCLAAVAANATDWPIDEALDMWVMPTAALPVTGDEIGLNPYLYGIAMFTGAASARFLISECGIIKNVSQFADPTNPWK